MTMTTLVLLLLAVGNRDGGDRLLDHHELRPSAGPVLNPQPHNCVVSNLRPVCFSSLAYHLQHWLSRLTDPQPGGLTSRCMTTAPHEHAGNAGCRLLDASALFTRTVAVTIRLPLSRQRKKNPTFHRLLKTKLQQCVEQMHIY